MGRAKPRERSELCKEYRAMNKPVAWMDKNTLDATHIIKAVVRREQDEQHTIPLYTHPVKEQDDYCKAYWGNDNKFVDVFLPNSETEVIRFWNNTHPVKKLTDEEIMELSYLTSDNDPIDFAKAILRKAQEK